MAIQVIEILCRGRKIEKKNVKTLEVILLAFSIQKNCLFLLALLSMLQQ